MESIKRLEPLALLVMCLAALDGGIMGLTGTNVLSQIFGSGDMLNVVYVVIGVAGLIYVPVVLEALSGTKHHVGHTRHT